MRRISHRDEPEHGLKVALKALAAIVAIGVLAMVAGQSAYTVSSGASASATPRYQVIEPAPKNAPNIGMDAFSNDGADKGHMMASAPKDVGARDRQAQ
jgi:hypothetical protein